MSESNEPQLKVVDRRWWARRDAAPAEEAPSVKPTHVEELERQLAETTTQLHTVMTEHRRAQQEFENIRVRMRREVARDVERGRRAMLADFLDVLDNLDRALASARDAAASGAAETAVSLTRGVALVRDQFLAKLEQFGVTRLEALGRPFDAAAHEAVSTVLVSDPAEEGAVVGVIREGYLVGDELLRPASVIVGRL